MMLQDYLHIEHMKVLVTGVKGQLGYDVVKELEKRGIVAVGVDIDPKAEGIARENAAYNGFAAPEFTALTGNVTADKKLMNRLAQEAYDLVLVNIVADVIIGLAPVLHHFVGDNTTVLLSGILDTREQDVLEALEKANFTPVQRKACEDWRCLKVRKKL